MMAGQKGNEMYKAGEFGVLTETVQGTYYRSQYFPSEQMARQFANKQWVKPDTAAVEIFRTGFYKKRRNSVVIASARRGGGQ